MRFVWFKYSIKSPYKRDTTRGSHIHFIETLFSRNIYENVETTGMIRCWNRPLPEKRNSRALPDIGTRIHAVTINVMIIMQTLKNLKTSTEVVVPNNTKRRDETRVTRFEIWV
jgi:hypothetical protein